MKAATAVVFGILLLAGSLTARALAAGRGIVVKAFVMAEAEDGKRLTDSFEVWDTNCNLRGTPLVPEPRCSITAVSLVHIESRTHVYTWRHDSESVREVRPNVFRIEMNGRMSECSGLQVVLRLDAVQSLEGDIRSGTQCQSRHTYSLDKASVSRPIAPIWNPAYR